MIQAILVINNYGNPRLMRFYEIKVRGTITFVQKKFQIIVVYFLIISINILYDTGDFYATKTVK